jgi:hypothetical protein
MEAAAYFSTLQKEESFEEIQGNISQITILLLTSGILGLQKQE